ncbi:Na-translocating system protein MpsC family protein [Fictibacillus fluitans]|uniref:Na-translocating system protein MpsC family protein n=1 Tax=Fictibacillus fluitans TaxID=3058422 RepID=A0ABT8I3T1_9BACL|nr:Na-translocating system protein MpsC family protein [Fictibacillus sp. NE201]MDN4527694.1 Na-translocating system protein MpsC family protein [Fictibacillus sp. NE201]
MDQVNVERELSSYIGRILRDHFGKGPGSVFVTVADPFITIYFTNFLSPTERSLLQSGQAELVQKIRDRLMDSLSGEITKYLESRSGMDILDFYYDWNLETKTGMFVAVSKAFNPAEPSQTYTNQMAFHEEIGRISLEAEKIPGLIQSYLINSRTLVVVRENILVNIEKEIIAHGGQEMLRIAKRSLEKRLLSTNQEQLEKLLNTKVRDAFIDWNFGRDSSSVLFILEPIA